MSKKKNISPIVDTVFLQKGGILMVDLTLQDKTQKEIIKQLKITEKLLEITTSKLSHTPKKANITALPDLGISRNVTRMMGGFFTGACYSWDCDVPFIPIDATVNVCGTAVYQLSKEIEVKKFLEKALTTLEDKSTYHWNYTTGNHFIILAHSLGEYGLKEGYYMIVHASANEYKYGKKGLYPSQDSWYQKEIQQETDEESSRYLRYITGESALRFYQIAKDLERFNQERNRHFVKKVLEDTFYEKEIININHYGMPDNHTICIGAHWEQKQYALLTSFQRPIYLITPSKTDITYSPHGLGLYLKNPNIEYRKNEIVLGNKSFSYGESIEIGVDAINRQALESDDLDFYVSHILDICKGNITGKLYQLASISKDGVKIFQKERKGK